MSYTSNATSRAMRLPSPAVSQMENFAAPAPVSNLDAQLRVAMRKELAALHAEFGGTMVYVTHDQTTAATEDTCRPRSGSRLRGREAPSLRAGTRRDVAQEWLSNG